MEENIGMSKPKKHANKVRWDPQLNKPLPTKYSQAQAWVKHFSACAYKPFINQSLCACACA